MPKINYSNIGEVINTVYLDGVITKIYHNEDTCDLTVEGSEYSKVPFFYHCNKGQFIVDPATDDGYTVRSNGAIKYGSTAFNVGMTVMVQCHKDEHGKAIPQRVIGVYNAHRGCNICNMIEYTPDSGSFTSDEEYIMRPITQEGYKLFPNNKQYSFSNSVTFSFNLKYEGPVKILCKLRQCIYSVAPIRPEYRPGFNGPVFSPATYPFLFDYYSGMSNPPGQGSNQWLKDAYYDFFEPPNSLIPEDIFQVFPFLLEYTNGYYDGREHYDFFKWTLPDEQTYTFPHFWSDDTWNVSGKITALDYSFVTTPGLGGTDYSMKLEFLGIPDYPGGGATYIRTFTAPLVMQVEIYLTEPNERYCSFIQGIDNG